MENLRKFLPFIVGGLVAVAFFFIFRKVGQSSGNNQERFQILEKAREAKLAKSILRKSDEDDTKSIAI